MNKIPSPVSFVLTIVFIIIMVVIGVIVFTKEAPPARVIYEPVASITPIPITPCAPSEPNCKG
jgi:hypothetical protein